MAEQALLYEPRLPLEPEAALDPGERIEELHSRLGSLESRVEGIEASLSLYEERIKNIEGFAKAAAMIGSWKAATCRYQVNGVCTLWKLSDKALQDLAGYTRLHEGTPRIDVAKAPWFCALCPFHQR